MDVSADSFNNTLETQFSNTTEGKWLKKNSHRAGFFNCYLKGKEHITGYSYEHGIFDMLVTLLKIFKREISL